MKRQTIRKGRTQSHGFKALIKSAMIARLPKKSKKFFAGGDLNEIEF